MLPSRQYCRAQAKRTNSHFGNCSGDRLITYTYNSTYVSDVRNFIAKSTLIFFTSTYPRVQKGPTLWKSK